MIIMQQKELYHVYIYVNDMLRTSGRKEAPIEDGEPEGTIHIHINRPSCLKIRVKLVPIFLISFLFFQ